MLLLLFLTAVIGSRVPELKALIVISANTPSVLIPALNSIGLQKDFQLSIVSAANLQSSDLSSSFLIIDLTYSLVQTQILSQSAGDYDLPVISLTENSLATNGEKYFLHATPSAAAAAIKSFISYLSWTNFIIFSSEGSFFQQCTSILYSELSYTMNNLFTISSLMPQDQLDNMIGKMVKTSSSRKFLIIASAEIAESIVTSLVNKKLYTVGSEVVAYGESIALLHNPGMIKIIEQGYEDISSATDYVIVPILSLLSYISSNLLPNPNVQSVSQIIDAYFEVRLAPSFSVLNINNGTELAGLIANTQVSITSAMLYPGGTYLQSGNAKTAIAFSYAGGSSNPSPIAPTTYNVVQMYGVVYAGMIANNDTSILPNFNFTPILTNCGVFTNNSTYISNCLSSQSSLGVGFISTAWSGSTMPYVNFFSPYPDIGLDTTYTLSNETEYPTFTRIVSSSTYWAIVIANFVHVNNWKRVIVLTSNTPKTIATYYLFVAMANSYGIKILNDENYRIVSLNYNRTMFEANKDLFQHCVDTGGRIFVFLTAVPDEFYIVEAFYDLGLRRGDMQVVSQAITGAAIFATETPENALKREELMMGSLGCYTAEWIGDYGLELKNGIKLLFDKTTSFKCVSFDSAMLMIHSVANVLKNGYDYEDPTILNKYIRQTRFLGCSGTVSISQGSNDRSNSAALLLNLFTKNNTWVEQETVVFDPASQTPFNIVQAIVWCDGTYNVPNDYRFSLNCPFDETKAKTSNAGMTVLYIICFIIAAVTTAISFFMLRVFTQDTYPEIKTKKIITAQDMAVFCMILVEIFQYFSLGITPNDSSTVISSLSQIFGINFKSIVTVSYGSYWSMITGMLLALWIWVALSIAIILRSKDLPFFKSENLGFIDFVSEYFMPVVGDLGFLPIISVLMNLYVCNLTLTGDLTQSYNEHDCTTFCWAGKHLTFAVISLVSLAVYIPLSLYLRPLWQSFQSTINIKTNSRHMVYKSIFQIFAIVLSKTLAYSNSLAFGFLYFSLLLAYAFFLLKFKAYNYDIANLWLVVSVFIASYGEFIYSVSISTEINGKTVLGALIAGWVVIGFIGYIIQNKKYVSFLYSEPSKEIPEIFKDMFRSSKFKYKVEPANEKKCSDMES